MNTTTDLPAVFVLITALVLMTGCGLEEAAEQMEAAADYTADTVEKGDAAKKLYTTRTIENIDTAIQTYVLYEPGVSAPDVDSMEELVALLHENQLLTSGKPALDGWGNSMIYEKLGPSKYRIISLGSDGAPGPDPAKSDPTSTFAVDIIYQNGEFVQGK